MAVPKRRTSKSRKRKRRAHHSLDVHSIPHGGKTRAPGSRSNKFFCSHCNQQKAPHSICANCGYFHGRAVVEVER